MESDLGITFTTNTHSAAPDHADPNRANDDAVMNGAAETETSVALSLTEDVIKIRFQQFILNFRVGAEFVYIRQLRQNVAASLYFLEVDVSHLQQFSEELAQSTRQFPTRILPKLELGAVEVAQQLNLFDALTAKKEIHIQLFWPVTPLTIRHLAHEEVAHLVCVSGIVIKSSSTHPRCTRATIQCTSCRSKTVIAGGRSLEMPAQCIESANAGQTSAGTNNRSGRCRPNSYVFLPAESEYEDQQVLKIQELPEDVPTGELPRHVTVIVDRYLVDRVSPGSRIQLVAIVSVQEKKNTSGTSEKKTQGKSLRGTAGLRSQYLRAVGIMLLSSFDGEGVGVTSVNRNFTSKVRSRAAGTWQPEDEVEFKKFAKQKNVYERLADSIDPAVFGLYDQKKAIVCLLFGGTRKKQENFLRGDINVLFIGDPSTAKSQLLKFTERVAPIGIYTSGKGSSAAGLTASVVGSGAGEFWLEAGSMVLADGGVVAIDEFDKMREQDQVAIHEAMEQQTISIAKANLTTMLNSRTSVLAAANPTMGSYDPTRTNEEQMDFQGSILSRFDLIFKIIDPKDATMDRKLATHVVNLHKRRIGATGGPSASSGTTPNSDNALGLEFVKKYIAYAKATCRPRVAEEAMKVLLDFFVKIRAESYALMLQSLAQDAANPQSSNNKNGGAPVIQITARQLESLVRITESLAKMRLSAIAGVTDAEEAIRLFKVATVDAIGSGISEGLLSEAQGETVLKVEEALRRKVAIGASVLSTRLTAELQRLGFDAKLVDKALYAMMRREELEFRKQRTLIYRAR